MKNHYFTFLEKATLPSEAKEYLTDSFNAIYPKYEKDILDMIDYLYNHNCSVESTLELRKSLAEKSNIHLYTVNFIFLVCASKRMLADFRKKGISENIFWDTILDLNYKLNECKAVHNVWGNFVETWYDIFFKCDIVKLGRLEFERMKYLEELPEVTVDGVSVTHETTVYSTHIPSCGTFTKELREDSYKRAKEFFADELQGKPMVLFCESWLMNPDNQKIYPNSMNIIDFQKEFNIIESHVDETYGDAWRVFSKDYNGNPDELSCNTTMQKSIINWLKAGNKMKIGFALKVIK